VLKTDTQSSTLLAYCTLNITHLLCSWMTQVLAIAKCKRVSKISSDIQAKITHPTVNIHSIIHKLTNNHIMINCLAIYKDCAVAYWSQCNCMNSHRLQQMVTQFLALWRCPLTFCTKINPIQGFFSIIICTKFGGHR